MRKLLALLLLASPLYAQTITQQPVSQTVQVGATATFTMILSDQTCSVLWQKNGSNISGGGGVDKVSYTTPIVALTDNGAKFGAAIYNCKVAVNAHAVPATLTVVPFIPVLTSLMIVPSLPIIGIGQTDALTVEGTYSDGSMKDLSSVALWSSDTPTTVSVGAGTILGIALGTANVSASVGTIQATTLATVEPSIQITFLPSNEDGSSLLNPFGFPLDTLSVSQIVTNADGTSNTTPVLALPDNAGNTTVSMLYNPVLLYQSGFFQNQQPIGDPWVFSPPLMKLLMPNLKSISFSVVLCVTSCTAGAIKSMTWSAQ